MSVVATHDRVSGTSHVYRTSYDDPPLAFVLSVRSDSHYRLMET